MHTQTYEYTHIQRWPRPKWMNEVYILPDLKGKMAKNERWEGTTEYTMTLNIFVCAHFTGILCNLQAPISTVLFSIHSLIFLPIFRGSHSTFLFYSVETFFLLLISLRSLGYTFILVTSSTRQPPPFTEWLSTKQYGRDATGLIIIKISLGWIWI